MSVIIVTQMFCNGLPSHDGDRRSLEMTTPH